MSESLRSVLKEPVSDTNPGTVVVKVTTPPQAPPGPASRRGRRRRRKGGPGEPLVGEMATDVCSRHAAVPDVPFDQERTLALEAFNSGISGATLFS